MKVYVIKGKRGKWVLRWMNDGNWKEETTNIPSIQSKKKLAERLAAQKELELDGFVETITTWDELYLLFHAEHLDSQKPSSRSSSDTALKKFNAICKLNKLKDISSKTVSRFVSELRKQGLRPDSIKGYLKRVMAVLNWAYEMGHIQRKIRYKSKQKSVKSQMRSRPITSEEYERMLESVETVRPSDYELWKFYLKGLWCSGLRLEESVNLGWDWKFDISIDIDSKVPHYKIMGEGQKSGRDEILPMSPEFVELLQTVPKRQRRGRVFKLPKGLGETPHPRTAGKVIAKIGRVANVVVNREGKTATAHDFRRSFGSRWALKVMPPILKQMMRHADIETTMKYYVSFEAEELWEQINKTTNQNEIEVD